MMKQNKKTTRKQENKENRKTNINIETLQGPMEKQILLLFTTT